MLGLRDFKRSIYPSNSGSRYRYKVLWKMPKAQINDNGELIEAAGDPLPYFGDKVDVYSMIQAVLPSTNLIDIYKRSVLLGDDRILHVREGAYGDFTAVPTSIYEADKMSFAALDKAKESFNDLDPNIKGLFKNSDEFIGLVLNNKIDEVLKRLKPTIEKKDGDE